MVKNTQTNWRKVIHPWSEDWTNDQQKWESAVAYWGKYTEYTPWRILVLKVAGRWFAFLGTEAFQVLCSVKFQGVYLVLSGVALKSND